MAFFTDTQSTTTTGWANSVHNLIAAFKESRAKRRVFAQTFGELRNLSNRELADLGLSRANIRSVAYEAAYGEH